MAARPQFTMDERNFLAFEYHKYRGTRGFKQRILTAFQLRFPGTRVPGQHQMRLIWEKQMDKGTVNNCNSKTSPGPTYSGRRRTARTAANSVLVKAVMDSRGVQLLERCDTLRSIYGISSSPRGARNIEKCDILRSIYDILSIPMGARNIEKCDISRSIYGISSSPRGA